MGQSNVQITIGLNKSMGEKILTPALSSGRAYKYQYAKQLVSRVRSFEAQISELPEEDQKKAVIELLKVEQNIAKYAADQFAALNAEEIFEALTEISEEIEGLIN